MIDLHSLYTPKQTETWLHKKWKEMKKKQTAVEWLVQQMGDKEYILWNDKPWWDELVKLIGQAKAMEKEQIMMAVKDSWYMAKGSNFQDPQEEQYYNETFKTENNG